MSTVFLYFFTKFSKFLLIFLVLSFIIYRKGGVYIMDKLTADIKRKIEENYKSTREFSQSIDVPYTTIKTALTKGFGGTAVDTVLKICSTLKLDISNYTDIEKQYSVILSEDDADFLRRYHLITPQSQRIIRASLDAAYLEYEEIQIEKQKKSTKKETEEEYKEPARRSLPDGVVLLSDYREEDKCDDNMVSMPIYDLGASAGTGVLLDSNYYEVAAMPDTPMTRKANFAIWVNGHSMEPKFKDGDLVLVRTQPTVDVGEIGIFIVNGNGFIKKQGEDRLISLNPDYDDVEISEWDEVYCKGKVLGKL